MLRGDALHRFTESPSILPTLRAYVGTAVAAVAVIHAGARVTFLPLALRLEDLPPGYDPHRLEGATVRVGEEPVGEVCQIELLDDMVCGRIRLEYRQDVFEALLQHRGQMVAVLPLRETVVRVKLN